MKPVKKSVKKSARERFVDHILYLSWQACWYDPKAVAANKRVTRRLHREYEREMAERAASAAMSEAEAAYRAGSNGYFFWYGAPRNRVRAAILKRSATPKAHGTRGKRGAK